MATLLIRDAHALTLDDAGTAWPVADIVIDGARIVCASTLHQRCRDAGS